MMVRPGCALTGTMAPNTAVELVTGAARKLCPCLAISRKISGPRHGDAGGCQHAATVEDGAGIGRVDRAQPAQD